MKKAYLITKLCLLTSGLLVQSCCTPLTTNASAGACGMPVATTETHTKTIQPASFSLPYMPPASVYQAPPMAFNQPLQAPQCQPMQYAAPQVQYQASPVCAPAPTYQAQPCQPIQYQAYQNPCQPTYQAQPYNDPCAPQPQYAPANIRYNVTGTAAPANASQTMQVHGPKPIGDSGDHCE